MRQTAFATSTTKVGNLPRRQSASSLDTHMTTGIKRSSSFDTDMDDDEIKRSSEPERSSSNRKPRSSRQRGTKQQRKLQPRDVSPEPPKRLVMCGADGIVFSDEVKESIQDVRVSVRQVVNVLQLKRKFGREEKDAVRETLRDMKYTMEEKVRGAFVCTSSPRRESKVKFNL